MESGINEIFKSYGDTSEYEKYVDNVYNFSANKDLTETEILKKFAEESKSYKDFKEKALELLKANRNGWLRNELDTIGQSLVMADKWQEILNNKAKNPYWVYRTMKDNRVRPEHAALEGKVFRVGSDGDALFPPNAYGCRCVGEGVSNSYLLDNNVQLADAKEYLTGVDDRGKTYIDPDFRYNPSQQVLPYAPRMINYKTFGL